MVVERKDHRIITAYKTKNPLRLFLGQATWSIMQPGEILFLDRNMTMKIMGDCKYICVDSENPDSIHFHEEYIAWSSRSIPRGYRTISNEAINRPGEPWHKQVRYLPDLTIHDDP